MMKLVKPFLWDHFVRYLVSQSSRITRKLGASTIPVLKLIHCDRAAVSVSPPMLQNSRHVVTKKDLDADHLLLGDDRFA
jgi:hypothetical protein